MPEGEPEAVSETEAEPQSEPGPARDPREGVPPLISDARELAAYARAVSAGTGPVALDAERASGYRYSQRAYLVQVRRSGAGTALIDPVAVDDLSALQEACEGVEWILHAATQDLPCLAELGLRPSSLFDTELAGRLLGRERVSLAALVGSELGEHLEKGHGAADWSVRPLTSQQLRYAALDVEWLIELRARLAAALADAGKADWAEQEFAALLDFAPRDRGEDPWRRTSGLHRLRKPRALAVVRSLWLARDRVAARIDVAPGRVLPDAGIIAAATVMPDSINALLAITEFAGRGQSRRADTWWAAIQQARELPEGQLPPVSAPPTGPPPPRSWADRDPDAWARLQAARTGLATASQEHQVPVENLLSPDLVRRVCWEPPAGKSAEGLRRFLADAGARPWQLDLTVPILVAALAASGGASAATVDSPP